MKNALFTGFVLFGFAASGCSMMPPPADSLYLETVDAGHTIVVNDDDTAEPLTAAPFITAKVARAAPQLMYVEAVFPDPRGLASPITIRQEIHRTDDTVRFDGPVTPGWTRDSLHTFSLRVFADPEYTVMLDKLEQFVVFAPPSEEELKQLQRLPDQLGSK